MKKFDLENPFVCQIKALLLFENENLDEKKQQILRGEISKCVIAYYFAKMHMVFLKMSLEQLTNKPWLSEEKVFYLLPHIGLTSKNQFRLENFPRKSFTDGNKAIIKTCLQGIEKELKENKHAILATTNNQLTEEELVRNIDVQMKTSNYYDAIKNKKGAEEYFKFKEYGIETYLYPSKDLKEKRK